MDCGQISQVLHAQLIGDASTIVTGVGIDSRKIVPGQLFVPLKGAHVDGHEFIPQAMAQGAAAVLVEYDVKDKWSYPGLNSIVVEDNLRSLQQLAQYWRSILPGQVVAVTGSNGKTTTKDMVGSILAKLGTTLKNPGNFNNELGLPLTLLEAKKEHQFIVVEMGMRGLGQISELAQMAQPNVGIVTNVGPVHLELLGSIENIAKAKGELVQALPSNGWAVLNADDPLVASMKYGNQSQTIYYGIDGGDVWGKDVQVLGVSGTRFTLCWKSAEINIDLGIPGRHNVYNALGAAGASLVLGATLEMVKTGLESCELTGMRMEISELANGITIVNDAYNASPASMIAALETLKNIDAPSKIAVLADMLELGPQASQWHAQVGQQVAEAADYLITIGSLGEEIGKGAKNSGMSQVFCCSSNEQALQALCHWAQPGSAILFKGSRGMALEELIQIFVEKGREI